MEDIKTYEILLVDETDGIYAFSLVSNPANETEFVLLSADENILKMSSEEKRIIMGPLLIPNQVIDRVHSRTGKKFRLKFTKEKIEELGRRMMRSGGFRNITVEHSGKLLNMDTQEVWFAGQNDKAHDHYAKERIPEGTLMVAAYVDDVELWNAVKASDKIGFSIEAMSGFQEIMMNAEKQMDDHEQKVIDEAKRIIEKDETEEQKLGRLKQLFDIE